MTREQAIKILMGYSHTPEERAAMETLIPELAESEDERIRRTLVEYFGPKVQLDFVRGIPIQKIRDWLEKQKDIEDRWIEDRGQCFWDGVEEGKMLAEKQKEQKPILEVFGFKVGDAVRLKDGDGRKHIIKSFEEVEGVHGPNFYHVEFEDNSARDGIYPGEEYPNGYYTQMEKIEEEQKPEWSEEDIKKIRSEEYTKGFNDAAFGGKLKEWSVEDEDRIRQIERIAQQAGCTQKLQEEIHDWLKSLRPSWKPSKEQMKALEDAFRKDGSDEYRRTINSLYQQLKRL